MGKSGGKKKKGTVSSTPAATPTAKVANGVHDGLPNGVAPVPPPDPLQSFLKRAHAMKEEGNRRFQSKDYVGALEQYNLALNLLPKSHPDRAVFHSNRAACLMQMRPVDHHAVAAECSLALQAQPGFPRALIRRARALEALGKNELALMDVRSVLASDPTHSDALEIAARLLQSGGLAASAAVANRQEEGSKPSSRPSPAALGASAVRGAPIAGIGPCLPSRPSPTAKKPSLSSPSSLPLSPSSSAMLEKPIFSDGQRQALLNGKTSQQQTKTVVLKPAKQAGGGISSAPPTSSSSLPSSELPPPNSAASNPNGSKQKLTLKKDDVVVLQRLRPLKLVYDHDIRLAEMPEKCGFRALREIVTKRFPSSKSVLIKYKDSDDDLVTITSTAELRLAESSVDQLDKDGMDQKDGENVGSVLKMLRLHIVEVSPEQEPLFPEKEEDQEEVEVEEEKPLEDDGVVNLDEGISTSSNGEEHALENGEEHALENGEDDAVKISSEEQVPEDKTTRHKDCNHADCKEAEIDDWLFEFAQLFRTHVGIDSDAHLDLHELGMEMCSEALEETVTSEEAQNLFDMAAAKFQEVAALAFFNWGNVHMCAARKRIPLDDSASKEIMSAQLQSAYDWVHERYALAGQKYEESLQIKPDFYEGLLALGQQHFENAKLQWSFAMANKVDLKSWDPSETIGLFNSAEEKMKAATEMWEKFEEQRANEQKDPTLAKKDELLRKKKKAASSVDGQSSADIHGELTATEAAEQAAVMRSQIHLFWGNMLFERSQVEFKLGFDGWKKNLDTAVERFTLAGASETDIAVVKKNHYSNEGVEFDEKKVTHLTIPESSVNDEDKHVLEG